MVSPSNTNSWHGLAKLNTMTFVFFIFTVNPRSTQNCWSAFNYCYSPISNSDVRTRSSTKISNHTCTSARVSAPHSLTVWLINPYNKKWTINFFDESVNVLTITSCFSLFLNCCLQIQIEVFLSKARGDEVN
jgi:hypothetical protein